MDWGVQLRGVHFFGDRPRPRVDDWVTVDVARELLARRGCFGIVRRERALLGRPVLSPRNGQWTLTLSAMTELLRPCPASSDTRASCLGEWHIMIIISTGSITHQVSYIDLDWVYIWGCFITKTGLLIKTLGLWRSTHNGLPYEHTNTK